MMNQSMTLILLVSISYKYSTIAKTYIREVLLGGVFSQLLEQQHGHTTHTTWRLYAVIGFVI